MTLYPPSNWVESTVPVEAGGCGLPHRRPYVNGKPVHPYALECAGCEDFLRKNNPDQWSATISELPETYDEKLQREDFEKRGALDERRLMAMALAKMTGIQIPESVIGALSGTGPHLAGMLECPAGHPSPPGQKFCGECGAPMSAPVTKAALESAERPVQPPVAESFPSQAERPFRIQDLRLDQLQAACRASGLPDTGVRKELMKRLRTAGVGNPELQHLLTAA